MNILLWHVHGTWTTAFVRGDHQYVVPVTPDRGPDGIGRARTFWWPDHVRELPPERLRHEPFDLVVLQRPHEWDLTARWLARRPGRDIPAVYVEHNTPEGDVPRTRHPLAHQSVVPVVHVTHFNQLLWDSGRAPSTVIEHGIVDPGPQWTGEIPHAVVVVNEPIRRGRATGTDLLPAFAQAVPLDVFGMRTDGLGAHLGLPADRCRTHDLPQAQLHAAMARRRVYLHPLRWTSLGLSLLEAMHLGMPVVVLAATEAVEAVPPEAGTVSTRLDVLVQAVRQYVAEPATAAKAGAAGRAAALRRYGLHRFLDDWDHLIKDATR